MGEWIRFKGTYYNLRNVISIEVDGKDVLFRTTEGSVHRHTIAEDRELVPLVTRLGYRQKLDFDLPIRGEGSC